jgi:Zn finger protein HypA/HybF involved in hydrogenase expression
MHDLLAAKEIIDEVVENANKNNLKKISKVVIELGQKKYAHGDHEHIEDINPENLEFNLKLFAKNTVAENARFVIKKSDIPDILVKEIEGE